MALRKSSRRATKSRPKDTRHGAGAHAHGHVEFNLSKRTCEAIEVAVRGLNGTQRARVSEAIDRVGTEAARKGAQWVERNVIGNANELLAVMARGYAADGHWSELRGICAFLVHLDVPFNHERIARQLEKEAGEDVARRYREELGGANQRDL